MARADLLVDLAKYALSGNRNMVKRVTEAIIAEERAKQHGILADRLQQELDTTHTDLPRQNNMTSGSINFASHDLLRTESLFQEIIPKRDSVILSFLRVYIRIAKRWLMSIFAENY